MRTPWWSEALHSFKEDIAGCRMSRPRQSREKAAPESKAVEQMAHEDQWNRINFEHRRFVFQDDPLAHQRQRVTEPRPQTPRGQHRRQHQIRAEQWRNKI